MLVRDPVRVSIGSMRWRARGPRVVFVAACCVLCLLGLRSLGSRAPKTAAPVARSVTSAPDGFAEAFARAYLTTSPGSRRDAELKAYGYAADDDVGGSVSTRLLWTAVVADQAGARGRRVVTVLGDDGHRRWYLAVSVAIDRAGRRFVPVAPALVGPPAVASAPTSPAEMEVDDAALKQVVARVVRHYVAGDASDLAPDLDRGAVLTFPPTPVRLIQVVAITWVTRPVRIAAAVTAAGPGGAQLSLRYELQVVRVGGRWLVRSVQVNPLDRREP